jgi:hypothetical protein
VRDLIVTGDESHLGALSRLLRDNRDLVAGMSEIERRLKIDGAFPATVNIIEFLLIHLESLSEFTNKPNWLTALNAAKISLKQQRKWHRTSSQRNPLHGNIQQYAITAFLLQEPSRYKKQINGIHSLFLFTLINQPPDTVGLDHYANELRVAIGRFSENEVLTELPELRADFGAYFDELKAKVHQLYDSNTSSEQRIISSLYKLIEKNGNAPRLAPIQQPPDISVKKPLLSGFGSNQIEILSIDVGNPESAEPPSLISVLVDDDVSSGDDDITLSAADSEFKTDLKAMTSDYWIRRHSRLVPHDSSCFTPLEKKRVTAYINKGLKNASDEKVRNRAGIVCMLYTTGLTLDDLLNINLNNDEVITRDGQFKKLIQRPENAFKPNSQQANCLMSVSTQFNFELPEILTEWLQEITQDYLWEVLSDTKEGAKEVIDATLVGLRRDGQYRRIILSRLTAALALETTLKFRDPVITHYLAGRDNQAAPMLTYYVAHPVSEVEQAYQNVVQGMLSQ